MSKKNKAMLNKISDVLNSAITDIKTLLDESKEENQEENILPEGVKSEDFDLGDDDDDVLDGIEIDYSELND